MTEVVVLLSGLVLVGLAGMLAAGRHYTRALDRLVLQVCAHHLATQMAPCRPAYIVRLLHDRGVTTDVEEVQAAIARLCDAGLVVCRRADSVHRVGRRVWYRRESRAVYVVTARADKLLPTG